MKELHILRTLYPLTRAYTWVAVVIIGVGILASLAEGIGISLMIPLLQSLEAGAFTASQQTGLVGVLETVFQGYSSAQRIVMIAIAMTVAIIIKTGLFYGNRAIFSWFNQQIGHRIRSQIFQQLLTLHYTYIETQDSGRLLNLLATESWQVSRALEMLVYMAISLCTLSVFMVFLLLLSWRLMVMISILMLLISLLVRYVTRQAQRLGQQAVQCNAALSTLMCEGLMGMRTIRAFNREPYEQQRFNGASQQVQTTFWRLELLYGAVDPLHESLSTILVMGVLVFASLTNPGSLSMILTFMFMLYRLQPQIKLFDTYRVNLLATDGAVTVVSEFLNVQNKPYLANGNRLFSGLNTAINFDQVSFYYRDQEKPALHQICLAIPHHQVTALVGPSGAGKSTLINLICRFYEPSQGQIEVDQYPLNQLDLSSWRSRLAIVSQDIHMFSASIRDNIAYGKLDATDTEIFEAAKRAHADEFIQQLDLGYDSPVGDRGLRLSGGQRQRLALARAIVRDPDILILDEATNALDTLSEHLIQEALAEFSRDRTVIVIAHRLSTIEQADQIVVLEQGEIRERGTLDQLLDQQGLFHQLYQLQYRHALPST